MVPQGFYYHIKEKAQYSFFSLVVLPTWILTLFAPAYFRDILQVHIPFWNMRQPGQGLLMAPGTYFEIRGDKSLSGSPHFV